MIHVSPQHKLLGVPNSPTIQAQFPGARVVDFSGAPHALLPHNLLETKLLRALGHDVPSPVLSQYDWPHPEGKPPFEVQRKTVAMMTTNQRAYNLNGMGTGKTRCALWAFDYLKKAGLANRALVVAPLSTLHFTWMKERFNVFPHLSSTVLHASTKAARLKRLAEDHDIYIVNSDGLLVMTDEIMARKDIDVIIIDELAVFRNPRGEKNKKAVELVNRMTWAWGMTGSPTPEAPTDAYGQCKILTPHTVPSRFSHFREQTMIKVSNFKWKPKADAKDTVFRVMQPAVRFTLDDVIELPELVEQTVDVAMGKKQEEIYNALKQHAHAMHGANEITAANAGAVLNKMLQVSLGYVYTKDEGATDRKVITLDNKPRLDRLVDDINASQNKVIVFAPFTHALSGIAERLTSEGIDLAIVDGGTPSKQRDNIFNLFQNTDKYKVLVAHPVCMSHGVTLTKADTIIWFGPIASLETFEQANARIRRIGQKLKQLILMYQATKAEQKMYANLRSKQKVQDGVLAMFASDQL